MSANVSRPHPHTMPVQRVSLPREGVVTHRLTPGGSGVVDIYDNEGLLVMAIHLPLVGELGRTIVEHLAAALDAQEAAAGAADREQGRPRGAAM